MKNYAGRDDVDHEIELELRLAGIAPLKLPESCRDAHPEMRTIVIGQLGPWSFRRAWYYWIAQGPGIPVEAAEKLHEKLGQEVRVAGHCGCPSPREWYKGFGVGLYHVDTQEGLNTLAEVVREILELNEGEVLSEQED